MLERIIVQQKPKIGWILKGDEKLASSRIHGINVHNYLVSKGWQSNIILKSAIPTSILDVGWSGLFKIFCDRYDVLILQQVGFGDAHTLVKLCSLFGTKTCFSVCDLIDYDIARNTNCVIVPSPYLRNVYVNINKTTYVMPDALEHISCKTKNRYDINNSKIKLVWLGTKDAWCLLDTINEILSEDEFKDFELITISDHENSTIKWSLDNIEYVWECIINNDIAIIPSFDTDWYMAKSNNKLSTFMSLGMPVVAHPIPAYQQMKDSGASVLLARTRDEWCQALSLLRSPSEREVLGRNAITYALQNFNIEKIGSDWENLLYEIAMK